MEESFIDMAQEMLRSQTIPQLEAAKAELDATKAELEATKAAFRSATAELKRQVDALGEHLADQQAELERWIARYQRLVDRWPLRAIRLFRRSR